jgi:hypothetical protein
MLIPVAVAVYGGSFILAGMAFTMMVLSVALHLTERSPWQTFDTYFEVADFVYALLFLCSGPYLLWSSQATVFAWFVSTSICCGAIGVYTCARKFRLAQSIVGYVRWHGLWHIGAAVLVTSVYITYFKLLP